MPQYAFLTFLALILLTLASPSCKHDPILSAGTDPIDTTQNPGPTNPPPTNPPPSTGMPCDPNTVYFQNQILPLLVSNCAKPGCHTPEDHEDGVVLTSYSSLMQTVNHASDPDWDHNELMEVLVLNDADERMPPAPNQKLTQAQIDLIAKWLSQGAQNNQCDENAGGCDTNNAQFGAFVQPLIQARCQGCHSGSAPQGGVNLTTYNGVKTVALNGKLYAAITRTTNWMPKGGAKLDDCTQAKMKAWIDAGAPQN